MSETGLSISVDVKKHRIRVHRTTLGVLGKPQYLQLLVNPHDRVLALRAVKSNYPEAHRVSLSQLNSDHSFELYSKSLITKLKQLVPELNDTYLMKLQGVHMPEKGMVLFSLDSFK